MTNDTTKSNAHIYSVVAATIALVLLFSGSHLTSCDDSDPLAVTNTNAGTVTPPPANQTGIYPTGYQPFARADEDTARFLSNDRSVHDQLNWETPVPAMCYTKTDGISNPCWTCHTASTWPNDMQDWELQEEYAFSDFALTNRWYTLFKDRSAEQAAISDDEALAWIREDNYGPFRTFMQGWIAESNADPRDDKPDYVGYQFDLDFAQGFDDEGFARDGSNWRAIRYKPFLGTFWPTNGNTDDVMIRLPAIYRQLAGGAESKDIYKINLAIVEALICALPDVADQEQRRVVEPISEDIAGFDLNGDGNVGGLVTEIRGLPTRYAGAANGQPVLKYAYPQGVEFVHTVRYVDPDQPNLMSTRMKEVRYSRKVIFMDYDATRQNYLAEMEEKFRGKVPQFGGTPRAGLLNDFGWQLQGFIETPDGRLRGQSMSETRFCMGCHSTVGVTVDQTFTLARKVPGSAGWKYQYLEGIKDVPQYGHAEPEILTYFKRVRGGDEFRANDEILEKFFNPDGTPIVQEVLRSANGGDRDILHLISPSRERAIRLAKAYMAIVRADALAEGRDTVILPPKNVFTEIGENGDTALKEKGLIFTDGKLWLDWDR